MNILAFDTSMGACSAAIMQTVQAPNKSLQKCLSARFEPMHKGHAERLLPMIKEVMTEAAVRFEHIDRIAVTLGPGTFTGVRIGVATARGLALASQKPIVSSSSLHVIALTWLAHYGVLTGYDEICVVLDARRKDVYIQRFTDDGQVLDQAQILSIEAASEFLTQDLGQVKRLFLGEGRALLQNTSFDDKTNNFVASDHPFLPDARALASIAHDLTVSETRISPLYLRAADAKIQVGKAIKREN